jgi:hypothetical protein
MSHPVAVPGAEESAPLPVDAPTLWLEIRRGRTQFPRRPILWTRFLIGAGSNCHLQLGGDEVPFLHSIIDAGSSLIRIEAFSARPELRVNGAATRRAVLADGDELEIGSFAFRLHAAASQAQEPDVPLYAPVPLDLKDDPPEHPAALTAAELVARLEAAERDVNDFETAERSGGARLLSAVQQWKPEAADLELSPSRPDEVEVEVAAELASISLDVEQQLAQLRQWHAGQAARADALISAQDRLAEQLRLAEQSLAVEQSRVRASA